MKFMTRFLVPRLLYNNFRPHLALLFFIILAVTLMYFNNWATSVFVHSGTGPLYILHRQKESTESVLIGNVTEYKGKGLVHDVVPSDKPYINILVWSDSKMARRVMKTSNNTELTVSGGRICRILFDRRLYNQSEAVVFQLEVLKMIEDYPTYRLPFHKWIFIEDEAPPEANRFYPKEPVLQHIKDKFNITSTFVQSSTLPMARYDYEVKLDLKQLHILRNNNVDYLANKTRSVAWFVSHCETQSRREDYVHELMKYIDVDVYGKCGNYSCSNMSAGQFGACDQTVLDIKYKFYLSFENSLCEGYVTEKLWRFLYKPISTIPIVMGYMNYSAFMPPGTVINVKDFQSPQVLARYLHYVAGHPEVYNEYVNKRLALSVGHQKEFDTPYRERLCEFLHDHRKDVMMVPDVAHEWSPDARCIKPWEYLPGDFWSREPYNQPS